MRQFYALLLGLLLSSFVLEAQKVIFTTRVPVNKMGTKDRIHVQYEIQNAQQVDDLQLANSNDFRLIGQPSKAINTSVMNGEVSMSVIITFSFQPKRAGRLTFPTAIAKIGNRKYRSSNASIDVVQGSLAQKRPAQRQPDFFNQDPFDDLRRMQKEMAERRRKLMGQAPNPNQSKRPNPQDVAPGGIQASAGAVTKENIYNNLFIRVSVDKEEVHVGEQLTANYKLYTRVPIQVSLTKLPDLNNFWTQDFDIPSPPQPKREVLNGIEYQVFTIRKSALFPTKSGELTLDAVEGEGIAQIRKLKKVRRKSPMSDLFNDDPFFSQGFGSLLMDDPMFNDSYFNTYEYEELPVKLKSKPLKILVKEMPEEDKPKLFKGAVGNFSLESKISAAEITTDDVATLTLIVRGTGNIKLLDPPVLKLPKSVEVFQPIEFDTITNKVNNKITGYKKIRYRFNPQATGVLKVPSLELAYYNADAERYEVKRTPEYTVRVKPGIKKPRKDILPMDIHDIQAENTRLNNEQNILLPEQMWYWGTYLLPTLGFIFLMGYKRREEEERKDNVRFKNKRANKVALKRLETAEQHRKANEQTKFYEETAKAVWLYLSDKLNIPLATLSKEMAGTLLRKRDIAQDVIDEVFLITDECELALYAPDAGDFKMNQIYSDSLKMIGILEEKLAS